MPKNSKQEMDEYIIQVAKEKKAENVKQLVKIVQQRFPLSQQEILDHILYLQENEKIKLKPPQKPLPDKLAAYLRSSQALWYWVSILFSSITVLFIFIIPEDAYPIVYVRIIFGVFFALWLPGYAFVKVLFSGRELDGVEGVVLSVGLSLALLTIVGLLLNYTSLGLRLTPIVVSLSALTLVLSTVAVMREYQIKLKDSKV